MELKEFVSQSLLQIFEGVKQAQSQTSNTGGTIAANAVSSRPQHPSVIGWHHNSPLIAIDFDVSVTTQDIAKDKAGLGIFVAAFAIGGQIGSESLNNQLSRLRFSVPVILPTPEK